MVNVRRLQLTEEQARLYLQAHKGGGGQGGGQLRHRTGSKEEQADNLTSRRLSQDGG